MCVCATVYVFVCSCVCVFVFLFVCCSVAFSLPLSPSPIHFPMTDPIPQVAVLVVPGLHHQSREARYADLNDPNQCYKSARAIGFTI